MINLYFIKAMAKTKQNKTTAVNPTNLIYPKLPLVLKGSLILILNKV